CFQQRSGDLMLLGGLLPRAEVTLIVPVHAVGNRIESARSAQPFHDIEEFVFALKATLPVIACILWAVEFRGGDYFDRDPLFFGEGDSVAQVGAGEAARADDHSHHVSAKSAVRSPGQIRGIASA